MRTVTTAIISAERQTNTKSGNPRWKLLTRSGAFDTEPDAQVNYVVGNWIAGEYVLTLNDQGRVIGIEEVTR